MHDITADTPVGYQLTPASFTALGMPPARPSTDRLLDAAHQVHYLAPEVADLLRAAIDHVDAADGWEAEGLAYAAVLGCLSGVLLRCEKTQEAS